MRKKAKFRIGQVVFWRGDGECYPFKIDRIDFDIDSQEHVYWSCDSEHLEKELRPLTAREKGQGKPVTPTATIIHAGPVRMKPITDEGEGVDG